MKGFIVKIIVWSVRIIYNRIHTVSEGDKKGGVISVLNIEYHKWFKQSFKGAAMVHETTPSLNMIKHFTKHS
jgi:hypothetical protein